MSRKKTVSSVFLALVLLCGCHNQTDLDNLNGNTGKADSSESSEENQTGGVEDLFIDRAGYDHFSGEAYQQHFLKNRTEIEELKRDFEGDVAELLNHPKKSFSFENCVVKPFPDVMEVSAASFQENNLTSQEAWDLISFWLEKWGVSDQVDMDREVYDAHTHRTATTDEERGYALAKEVWDKNDGSQYNLFNRDVGYIQLMGSGVSILSRGRIGEYVETIRGRVTDRTIDPYDFYTKEVVAEGSCEELGDASYMLLDGEEMSVSAAKQCLDEFYTKFADGLSYEVYGVKVYKVEDRFVYKFLARRTYKGIPLPVQTYGGAVEYVHSFYMQGDTGRLYVADHSGVCAYLGFNTNPVITNLGDSQTRMIGVKEAMDIVYGIMSDDYKCNIDSIELCRGDYASTDASAGALQFLPVCWEFIGHSPVSGKNIRIDVDVLTGELGYREFE